MTTEVDVITGIELPQMQLHTFITQRLISEISPLIDFDELIFDFQNVVGDGTFGTVFRGTVSWNYKLTLGILILGADYLNASIEGKRLLLKCSKFKKCSKIFSRSLNVKLI